MKRMHFRKIRFGLLQLLALASIILASFVFSSQACAQQNDYLVVPGERIGLIKVGMPASDLEKKLGKCDNCEAKDEEMDRYIFNKGQIIVYVTKKTSRVWGVFTMSQKYSLANGLVVGTPEKVVIKKLGEPDARKLGKRSGVWSWVYRSKGLTVGIDKGKVDSLFVSERSR